MKIQRVRLGAVAALLMASACMSDQMPTAPMTNAKTLPPPPPPVTNTIAVKPQFSVAGSTATGTITLVNPAPAGGLVIPLSTDLPLTITLPASVTVTALLRALPPMRYCETLARSAS